MSNGRHAYLKPKICVFGAAETGHCGLGSLELGKELGRQIAEHGALLLTGAMTGFPLWAAMGAKEKEGVSVGFSPANSFKEHVEEYKLPTEYMDWIIYTGFDFSGRNLMLARSSDALIIGCGRMGTLNEFTIAYEDNKPIGILKGEWETDELIEEIIKKSHRGAGRVVYDSDPKVLVERILEMIKEDQEKTAEEIKEGK